MPTPVPAIDRTMAVLNHLAERPQTLESLSEIARATGIHKATCAAVLAALAAQGMVRRTDGKRYQLGPELVRLSYAYTQHHRGFQEARVEMVGLAAELGLSCSICALEGDEMVILDIAGDTRPSHVSTRVGKRFPLAPPLGTIFKVWCSPQELHDWMARMEREYGVARETQLTVISAIRSRGYSLGSEQDFNVQLDAALRRLAREDSDVQGLTVAMMLADKLRSSEAIPVDDEQAEPVSYIVGPIFGPDQRVAMSLNLFGQPGEIRRRDVDRLAPKVLAASARVTRQLGGSTPSADAS